MEIDLTYTVLSGFILLPLTIVDIPLSIVADTLTLPVVSIIKNRERAKWQEITLMAKQGQVLYKIKANPIHAESMSLQYTKNGVITQDSFMLLMLSQKKEDCKSCFFSREGVKYEYINDYIHLTFPFSIDTETKIVITFKEM